MARLFIGCALACALVVGCGDGVDDFVIHQMQAPSSSVTGCVASSDRARRLSEGTFDVALRRDYRITPLLSLSGSADARVFLDGFVFEVHEGSPDGPIVGRPFSVYQSTTIAIPASGSAYQAVQVQAIPTTFGDAFRATVCAVDTGAVTAQCPVPTVTSSPRRMIVSVLAFGHTDSREDVETPTYNFPVNVCCGCLVEFPTEADAPESAYAGPDCTQGAAQPVCDLGQDAPVDCRLCSVDTPSFCQPRGFRANGRSTEPCPR